MIDKTLLILKRNSSLCDCGCRQMGHDLHHALIGRLKRFPKLDAEENLVLVNHWEHAQQRKFDTLEWRQKFWQVQCRRYGEAHMHEWIASLPMKLHHRIDFLGSPVPLAGIQWSSGGGTRVEDTRVETSKRAPEMVPCECDDWAEGLRQIISDRQLALNHGIAFTGIQFRYCPWCGAKRRMKLTEANAANP